MTGRDEQLERLLAVETADQDGTPMPVTVLTGFLGAGKTTPVNRILLRSTGFGSRCWSTTWRGLTCF
jgi:tRNA A37 threonylcarbamoyladenosine biosynthesis protein TsaE